MNVKVSTDLTLFLTKTSFKHCTLEIVGTNKYASQKGMSFGVRHGADIRADDLTKQGADVIGLQAGTNRYATQKGMTFGGESASRVLGNKEHIIGFLSSS